MCGVVWTYTGPLDKSDSVFKPIRDFKKPALDMAGPLPHPVLQSMFDGLYPTGLQWYWRSDFVNEFSEEAISKHLSFAETIPTFQSSVHIYPINGAAARVNKKDTPWNFRDTTWSMVIFGVDPDPANKEKISSWSKQYWEAVHPYTTKAAYLNFIGDEGEDRVKAFYGDNYARLVTIKSKYDPNNLFRVNQNIKPSLKK
jgi:FAD/FMN-containing dehydrogenase